MGVLKDNGRLRRGISSKTNILRSNNDRKWGQYVNNNMKISEFQHGGNQKHNCVCFSDRTDTFNAFGRHPHKPFTVHLRWTFFNLSACVPKELNPQFTLTQRFMIWYTGTRWEEMGFFCMGEMEDIKELCNANFSLMLALLNLPMQESNSQLNLSHWSKHGTRQRPVKRWTCHPVFITKITKQASKRKVVPNGSKCSSETLQNTSAHHVNFMN